MKIGVLALLRMEDLCCSSREDREHSATISNAILSANTLLKEQLECGRTQQGNFRDKAIMLGVSREQRQPARPRRRSHQRIALS